MSKIKNILILGLCTFLSGAINYATYPILIRHLSLADFAEFSVLANLIALFSIPAIGFGYHILILVRNHPEKIKHHMWDWKRVFFRYGILYSLAIAIILAVLTPILWLHSFISSSIITVSVGISLFAVFFATILQARERFILIGIIWVILAALRFMTSLWVFLVPTVSLAVASLIIPSLLALGLYYYFGSRELPLLSVPDIEREESKSSFHHAFMIIAVIVCMQNIDIITMKYLFHPHEVALYASVSVIAKFALVIISLFDTIYLPTLLERQRVREHKIYFPLLLGISFAWFVISYTILPPLGEWVLASIRPELSGGAVLFFYLGVAAICLGFFTIFIKALTLSGRGILFYLALALFCFAFAFFQKTTIDFSWYYMITLSVLYVVSALHLGWKIYGNPRERRNLWA